MSLVVYLTPDLPVASDWDRVVSVGDIVGVRHCGTAFWLKWSPLSKEWNTAMPPDHKILHELALLGDISH